MRERLCKRYNNSQQRWEAHPPEPIASGKSKTVAISVVSREYSRNTPGEHKNTSDFVRIPGTFPDCLWNVLGILVPFLAWIKSFEIITRERLKNVTFLP